jgi:hypothetical protein
MFNHLQAYLEIQLFRFYFKCTRCSAELLIKTDPQNSDYIVESGATRNFEPWREEDEVKAYPSAYNFIYHVISIACDFIDKLFLLSANRVGETEKGC